MISTGIPLDPSTAAANDEFCVFPPRSGCPFG
jgi:hypothetical protein